jgi:hypothetical protein
MNATHGISTYQRICATLAQIEPRPYSPQFRVAKERWGWRVFDGDAAIALFTMEGEELAFDIWQLSPFEAPIMANSEAPGAVYDLHTAHNTVLNLPVSRCGDLTEGVASIAECLTLTWVQESGTELRFRIDGAFLKGQRICYDLRFCYDATQARYRFFIDAEMWKESPHGGEPINMMLAGALTERGEDRRWSHSIWADPQDRLKRIVHSNALFQATDYASASWRSKNAPTQGAWIAYASHPVFNPAMLVHESNVPVFFATCSQLFDEHLVWQQAGLDELDEGFFHFVMRTEFVNLPATLAAEFLAEAADPPKPARWQNLAIALPFYMDIENDLEMPVDPWLPEDCTLFVLEDPRQWATDAAHSGTHSIRLTGATFHTWQRLFPVGAVCRVQPHSRYRFSAWVKTAGVERFARLEMGSYEYTYHNVIDKTRSAHLSDDCDWTLLQVELDTEEEVYVMPFLALYGRGSAWFDDVKLERIG